MNLYRIENKFFQNVTQHQREKMLEDFELDENVVISDLVEI